MLLIKEVVKEATKSEIKLPKTIQTYVMWFSRDFFFSTRRDDLFHIGLFKILDFFHNTNYSDLDSALKRLNESLLLV